VRSELRTLFFGTSEFAVPSLHAAARSSRLVGIVTQPDRPAGRGQKLRPTPVKVAAEAYDVPIYGPRSLKAFAAEHAGEDYDLFAVASYGRILPEPLLALPRHGALNVHPSVLPKYRGATPIQAALRNGDSQTGVSIILMDRGMDTGPVIFQRPVPIEASDDYGSLHDRLAEDGAELLAEAIGAAARGQLAPHPQTGEATLTKPLQKDDLAIDWSWPARRIVNAVRAYSPQPAARATVAGAPVKILRAKPVERRVPAPPGALLEAVDDALVIACGDSAVEIERLIPQSRSAMPGKTFVQRLKTEIK
jgi:methionyl-tRNA formyltransferase